MWNLVAFAIGAAIAMTGNAVDNAFFYYCGMIVCWYVIFDFLWETFRPPFIITRENRTEEWVNIETGDVCRHDIDETIRIDTKTGERTHYRLTKPIGGEGVS